MKKIIVTTTINAPTEAIRRFDAMEDWELLVIADQKTPAYDLCRGTVLWPWDYELAYGSLIEIIGFNSVRLGRMVGFIEAYRRGADIIASIDDDCMPEKDWGKNVYVGQETKVAYYEADKGLDPSWCFDPYQTSSVFLPTRGMPLEQSRELGFPCEDFVKTIFPLVQCDACYGQGDLYAFSRLAGKHVGVKNLDGMEWPCASNRFAPVNTQNTFIHRLAIKDFYGNIPFIGRADDIWAGYIFQQLHPDSTIFGKPSATHLQERSIQSIVDDLEDEIFMYRHTLPFLQALSQNKTQEEIDWTIKAYAGEPTLDAIQCYRSYFK